MADKMRRVLSQLSPYSIVIGEAAINPRFQRIDLCVSERGMQMARAMDKQGDTRVYGNDDRGSINTTVPIYLWGDGDGPSRYLRLAMSYTATAVLFEIKMRSVPGEPAKPEKT